MDIEQPRRWRFVPRSLTGRLVTGVVTLVFVVVFATGVGTYFALRSFLYERLDQQLQEIASTSSIPDLFKGVNSLDAGALRTPQHVWAIALGGGGLVLSPRAGGAVDALDLSPADRNRLAARTSPAPITVRTEDNFEVRVTVRLALITVIQGGLQQSVTATAVIGLSTDEVTHTLKRLVVLELVIGAGAGVLAFVVTAYGVRFSLRRLYGVTQTAQEVAAELSPEGTGLDRRVPVTDPDTEVGRLAVSMNTLLATVETQFAARLESERRMRQFLADASHELRTPLTSIRGYAELARMQRALAGAADPASDNLERIESEGTRMSRLVDDLLTLARSDRGTLPEWAPIDVDALLEDVVTSSHAAFPERTIEIDGDTGLAVVGDQDQLLRVIRNLVANAATHTRPGGPIGVRAFIDGPGVAIQVLDSGPGLPPDEAAHVFERFWRADRARSRARGGSGLGLAIVVSIVQLHGGTVRFDSAVETGSTVTVWLPALTVEESR
ncbi:MAG: HAMP domain-containing sensor histidine kinase [Jatrophihabitantaceae bacterium]